MGEGAQRADEGGVHGTPPNNTPDFTRVSTRLKTFARDMRKQATGPEEDLWQLLRNRRFTHYKFRHQVPIGPYVADFCCYSAKLVVELDGSQHGDSPRDADFVSRGFRTLRVWNNELTTNREGVLEAIWLALETKQ